MTEFNHVTVLLEEAVEQLNIKPDGVYVDCTLGGGGHTSLILSKLSDIGWSYCRSYLCLCLCLFVLLSS